MDTQDEARSARQLIDRCLHGDAAAIRSFQELYGQLVYGYPLRVYKAGAEAAADFYVFALESGRIFRRARTYAGRAPFRAYLLSVVLDHLFIDWRRTVHEVEMVPLDDADEASDAGAPLSHGGGRDGGPVPGVDPARLLAELPTARAIVMKLLYIEDFELDATDVRHLVEVSRRSATQVIAAVERLRATVRRREVGLQRLADKLDVTQAWIEFYERRLHRLVQDLRPLAPKSAAALRIAADRERFGARIRRLQHHRAKLLAAQRSRRVTAPYKDIAAILNTSVGNVGSQIARLREALMARARGRGAEGDSAT